MLHHIGIVACSAEGAALCYRTICTEGPSLLGDHAHPEVSMHTHSLADYVDCLERDDLAGVGELMLSSARKLAGIGAEFLVRVRAGIDRAHAAGHRTDARRRLRCRRPWLHRDPAGHRRQEFAAADARFDPAAGARGVAAGGARRRGARPWSPENRSRTCMRPPLSIAPSPAAEKAVLIWLPLQEAGRSATAFAVVVADESAASIVQVPMQPALASTSNALPTGSDHGSLYALR